MESTSPRRLANRAARACRNLVAGPLAVLLLLACGAAAAQGSAQLQVSARVTHYFKLNVVSQPRSIDVSEQDVARGYVDLPMPVELALESNSANGYTLVFERDGGDFAGAQVRGLGQSVQVGGHAAIGWRPAARRETMQFQVRLQLAPQLPPGSYRWPLQVSISPG